LESWQAQKKTCCSACHVTGQALWVQVGLTATKLSGLAGFRTTNKGPEANFGTASSPFESRAPTAWKPSERAALAGVVEFNAVSFVVVLSEQAAIATGKELAIPPTPTQVRKVRRSIIQSIEVLLVQLSHKALNQFPTNDHAGFRPLVPNPFKIAIQEPHKLIKKQVIAFKQIGFLADFSPY
jgi:hypothetical protein